MSQLIKDFLQHERLQFSEAVSRYLGEQKKIFGLLTPEFRELISHLETYLLLGGKWNRSLLGLLSYRVAGGKINPPLIKALSALELMHRYILIHDDVIDQDFVRHGGPTIEKIYHDRFVQTFRDKSDGMYSKGTAIVAGDVVNSLTMKLVTESGLDSNIIVPLVSGFSRLMVETCAGWQLQTEQNFQAIKDVTEEAFEKGMILVSAQYSVVWPLRIGQILAGRLTQDSWDPQIEKYGLDTGIAFQLADDLLGMFGDEKTTGKPSGHDYREGKKTFLILRAYDKSNDEDKLFLEQTLGTDVSTDQLTRVRQIMTDTGAVEYTKLKAAEHVRNAKEALRSVKTTDTDAIELLADLAELLANRDH